MYCPNCGVGQSDERKFCTACGTNLILVSAALSGHLPSDADQLAVAASQHRRGMAEAIQRGAPGLGMLVAALLVFMLLPGNISVWITFGLVIGGVATLGRGISQYYLAREELKLAELRARSAVAAPPTPSLAPPDVTTQAGQSITEHTTRHLG